MAANSWEKNLGSKFFWMKIRGAKWGTNFLKGIFLGGNFGEHVFEEQILWGRNFASKIFGEFLASKMSFGEKKRILGSKNVLEERYGEQKFLRANCYL